MFVLFCCCLRRELDLLEPSLATVLIRILVRVLIENFFLSSRIKNWDSEFFLFLKLEHHQLGKLFYRFSGRKGNESGIKFFANPFLSLQTMPIPVNSRKFVQTFIQLGLKMLSKSHVVRVFTVRGGCAFLPFSEKNFWISQWTGLNA